MEKLISVFSRSHSVFISLLFKFENIIIRATAKNPKNRYDSVEEMYEEAKVLWNSNKYHYQDEVIEGFPTGNCYVGFTLEDFYKLCELFSEPSKEAE